MSEAETEFMFKPLGITSLLLLGLTTEATVLAKSNPAIAYNQKALAAVLVAEAGIDKKKGMTSVAEVIRNRAREKKKSPLQVIRQKGAFTSLAGRTLDRVIREAVESPVYPEALEIAWVLLNHPEQLPNNTNNATHFDRIGKKPYWAATAQVTATIGRHRFYRTRY